MKTSSILVGVASAALLVAAAAGANAQSWADSTTVSGRIYTDITDLSAKVNGVKTAGAGKQGVGYDIKRFYIGFDHKFTDQWSTNVTLDNSLITGTGMTTYLKKAYLQYTYSPALIVSVGANDLPWVPYAESIYNYRYLENTLIDKASFGTSADWGVHVAGALPGGIFSYQVSAVNGNGYRNPTRQDGFDVEGRLSAKIEQWNFAIGARTGYNGQKFLATSTPTGTTDNQHHKATRLDALAAYVGDRTRVGVEYFSGKNDATNGSQVTANNPLITGDADKQEGTSVFGSYRITPTYTVFARTDEVKPNQLTSPNRKDTYYNFGVSWNAFKNVDFSLAEKHTESKVGATAVNTPYIPSAISASKGVTDEVGVWAQLRY